MILALDLGTTTGYALRAGLANSLLSGSWDFKPRRFEGGGMRYLRLRERLNEMHDSAPLKVVYFEEVRRHKGVDAAHVYGGLLGVLTSWCEEKGVPYEGVPVGTIKKYATGKGNADKNAMVAAVREWGYEPDTHDEADAIALLRLKTEG